MPLSVVRDFIYTFKTKELESVLRVPVPIPFTQHAKDLTGRLVFEHNLPCHIENDLTEKLEKFILTETNRLCDENDTEVINKARKGEIDLDKLVNAWDHAFTQEVKAFAEAEKVSKEQTFSEVYHSLIHSPALETLLNLEHTYALTIDDLIQQRDKDLEHIETKQDEQMQAAVRSAGSSYNDGRVNHLAQLHLSNSQMMEGKWLSEILKQQNIQKGEFREWIMKVHEDSKSTGTPKYMQRVRTMTSNLPDAEEEERTTQIRMEESFTIILGAQMKTTHNLRLLCGSIMDLCRHKPHTVGGLMVAQPQRLQTAMSLYSSNLNGLIMLVDNKLNSYTGCKQDFAKICESSTDFHFPNLQEQFDAIGEKLKQVNETRKKGGEDSDKGSVDGNDAQDKSVQFCTGDFYITRHSNLSEVHTVFNLVTDDSMRGEISSRHPVILSLRSIIKLCFRYDIMTLTIPLLLTHRMQEEMTIPWCMKRAELVFKCVKGFMMEMATYGGLDSRTVQFLVPNGISEELFNDISRMLPTIFRLSNPVYIVKS